MFNTTLLDEFKADCQEHGHGRKKWWASYLGVPPLTISHWLAGRQFPSGDRALAIQHALHQLQLDIEAKQWLTLLFDLHYQHITPYPTSLLPLVIPKILSASALDSRNLAFLSHLIERESPPLEPVGDPKLSNRLGWLLEISHCSASFPVNKGISMQHILKIGQSYNLSSYFKRHQTPHGKKWKILDCDLTQIKDSFL